MFKIFIIDDNFEQVYISLESKYIDTLASLGVHPDRAKSVTVSMESLAMVWDKQMHHIILDK